MSTIETSFGQVPLSTLVQRYEKERIREAHKYEKRLEFLNTDEGKAWNRSRAKAYYERNREAVLARRKASYQAKKEASGSPSINLE